MIYEVINPNFSEIREIRYGDKILRKAGSSYISDPDFLETDFKYFQDKLEFSDPSILGFLEDSDKVRIGSGEWSEETYLLTLFPTLVPDTRSTAEDITYFSTYTDSKGDELLCITVPENIVEVKMYEKKGDNAESVRVTFQDEERKPEEIGFSKVLWILTSYKEGNREVNLSWTSYLGDKNPNRRMSDYVLRNDGLVENYSGTKVKNGLLYSEISGSLIGTEKILKRPIFDMTSDLVGDRWNKRRRYSIGDIVIVGRNQYRSLESNNIGNHPYYSRMWVKKEVVV